MRNLKFKRYSLGDSFDPLIAEKDTIHLVPVSIDPLIVTMYDVDEYGNAAEVSFDGWKENKEIFLNQLKDYEDKTKPRYNDTTDTTIGNILKRVELNTGEDVNYQETTTWYDDSAMDDSKLDNVIYIKKGDKYYKRQFENSINLKWFKGRGYSNTDHTIAVQKAFDLAVGLNKSLIVPEGEYFISNNIIVNGSVNIFSKGSFFLKNDSNKSMFVFEKSKNVTIEGLVLNGNRTNQGPSNGPLDLDENRHGIKLHRCKNVIIKNCEIYNCQGDGVGIEHDFVGEAKENTVNENITIQNNKLYSNGRNGVSVVHAKNVTIHNNIIYDHKAYVSTLGSGIDVEPNPGLSPSEFYITENVSIYDNVINENNEGIQIFKGKYNTPSPVYSKIKNVKVFKNSFRNNVYNDILILAVMGAQEILIDGNTILNNITFSNTAYYAGVRVVYSDSDIIVSNNVISRDTPIEISSSKHVSVFQNTLTFRRYGFLMRTDYFDSQTRNTEFNQVKNNKFIINSVKSGDEAVFYKLIAETEASKIQRNFISDNLFIEDIEGSGLNAFAFVFANASGWNNVIDNKLLRNYVKKQGAINTVYVNTPTNNEENIAL